MSAFRGGAFDGGSFTPWLVDEPAAPPAPGDNVNRKLALKISISLCLAFLIFAL
jgi:hypothetical protein